jgi:hypothetical protein
MRFVLAFVLLSSVTMLDAIRDCLVSIVDAIDV